MNTSLVWGTVLILTGLSFVLKSLFHITIPLVRPLCGCFLIYLGLSIIMDPFNESSDKKSVIFAKSSIIGHPAITTYNVTLGSTVVDLSGLYQYGPKEITVNAVMGSTLLLLNPEIPTKVRVNAILACAKLPDETLVSFGRNMYKTTHERDPLFTVQVNVILGNVDVRIGSHDVKTSHEPAKVEVEEHNR